ncbi:MAG: DUF4349 domain-containing protein, partial [Fimbriimonadaceae bacterium]
MESAARSEPAAPQPTSSTQPSARQPETAKAQTAAYSRRDVVRHAELSIRVPNIEKSERAVGETIHNVGGYVEGSETSDLNASTPQISMKLKVPVDRFEDAIQTLETQGHRLSKKTSVEDVTGQLVDYEARLKIMLAQEASMRNMLKGATNYERAADLLLNGREELHQRLDVSEPPGRLTVRQVHVQPKVPVRKVAGPRRRVILAPLVHHPRL